MSIMRTTTYGVISGRSSSLASPCILHRKCTAPVSLKLQELRISFFATSFVGNMDVLTAICPSKLSKNQVYDRCVGLPKCTSDGRLNRWSKCVPSSHGLHLSSTAGFTLGEGSSVQLSQIALPPSPQSCSNLAALALVFCKVASIISSLKVEIEKGRDRNQKSKEIHDNAVEEFLDAERGKGLWKPGLEKAMMQQGGLGLALLSTTAMANHHLRPVLCTLRANPTFMSGLIAWAIAQVMKVFTYYFVERKWDFKMVMGSGGMPSSHSALCFGLTTSVAICHGVGDALFPVCLGFSLIVMYDAAGVRRHAGKQAEVLNMIVADLFQGHPVSEKKLKELLGHTPLQVFVGATLGILVGYACSHY